MESYSVLGIKTKQHPHKLSSTTAKFRNQVFRVHAELNRVTLLQTPLHFRPWQRIKLLWIFIMYGLLPRRRINWGRSKFYLGSLFTCLDPHFPFVARMRCAKKSFSLLLGQTAYICVYVCMYVWIIYVCMYYVFMCECTYVYVCKYVCIYVCMYVFMYVCMYTCMFCIYVYMYLCGYVFY